MYLMLLHDLKLRIQFAKFFTSFSTLLDTGGNTLTSAAKWISINSGFLHNHTSSQNAESGLIQATKQNPQHYKSKIKKLAAKKNTHAF